MTDRRDVVRAINARLALQRAVENAKEALRCLDDIARYALPAEILPSEEEKKSDEAAA